MNRQKIGIIAVVMGMAALVGCNLEEPIDYGESCPGVVYIQDGENICLRGECGIDEIYFENETCPDLQPFCIIIPKNDVYCASDCPERTHMLNEDNMTEEEMATEHHSCEADTVEHCGPHRDICGADGWVDFECSEDYRCVATKCADTYRLDNDSCVRYSMCCGIYCSQCSAVKETKWYCSGEDETSECIDSCEGARVNCDDLCIDPRTDNHFCGANDKCKNYERCEEGQTCVDGICVDSDD